MIMKRLIAAIVVIVSAFCSNQVYAKGPGYEQPNYLNSIKITFLSWTSGSSKVSYERAFPSVHQSGEICASLICAGYDKYHNDPMGFTVRYGHKFFMGASRDEISLKGFYLRPEVIYSNYNYNCTNTGLHHCKTSFSREKAAMVALLGTVGYQYLYRRFLADLWVGAGYAYGNPADTGYHHGFQLWDYFGSSDDHLAVSFSLRFGICF
jgi:hypothetical protein